MKSNNRSVSNGQQKPRSRNKEWVTERGARNLGKVARWLEAGAPHVDISGRRIDSFDMTKGIESEGCGTACCIAGALVQFNGGNATGYWTDIRDKAMDLGGITEEADAYELFGLYSDGQGEYEHGRFARLREVKPEGAAKVIRKFVRTGEVDWDAAFK